jgi:hypothetical protein
VEGAVYEISLPAPQGGITGLRLEALADPSLPNGGPGRNSAGNFLLTRLTVLAAPAGDAQSRTELELRTARADFMQHGGRILHIFEKPWAGDSGWAVYPAVGRPHEAVFEFERPVDIATGGRWIVRLGHYLKKSTESALGCFRLSLTTGPNPARLLRLRDELMQSDARGWPRLAAVAALCGKQSAAILAIERSATLEGTLTGEELFLVALAASWLDQPDAAAAYLARGLELRGDEPFDATRDELARDAICAIRHVGDTAAGEFLP